MRILIVEDERVVARHLERNLRSILPEGITSLKIAETLTAAECFVQEHTLDLVFLDLNLNEENGFELLHTAAAESFHAIVVSAYTDRALKAFEFGVLDFVPKPFTRERLEKALERFQNASARSGGLKYLSIRKDDMVEILPLESVLYFQASGKHTLIKLTDGREEEHRKSLDALMRILPEDFRRVHRSYIAAMSRVRGLHVKSGGRYRLEMTGGESIPVSRDRYRELKELVDI